MSNSHPVVAFVPREVFSTTEKCLRRLYEVADEPFDLVCIDGNSDSKTQLFLESFSKEKGFALIRTEQFLPPNRARNMAYEWARENTNTDYIVFVDNDVLVSQGWLSALVKCADDTGAGLVGPAYYEHMPECSILHMYGGVCGLVRNEENRLVYFERHDCQHLPVENLDSELIRKKTDLIEFHTVLIRMNFLSTIGGLDEGMICHAEHGDISMTAKNNGFEIWMEPAAKITYVPPKRLAREDRHFFLLRWSEEWIRANQKHFQKKWGIENEFNSNDPGLKWLRRHRGYAYPSVRKVRRVWGKKIGRFYEKKIFTPLESKWNRFKYTSEKWL